MQLLMANLPPPPSNKHPITSDSDGTPSDVWIRWFNNFYNAVNGSNLPAPSTAAYVVNTPNAVLGNAQALSQLNTGFVKVNGGTGILNSTGNSSITTADLAATGVTSGIYGGANAVPIIQVGIDGRITSISTASISSTPTGAAGGDLTGNYPNPTVNTLGGRAIAPSAYVDTTNAANITSNTLAVVNGGTGLSFIPCCSVTSTASTTLATSAYTQITFNTKNWDVGSYFNTSTSTYTPLISGTYLISATICLTTTTKTGQEYKVAIYKNGSIAVDGITGYVPANSSELIVTATTLVQLNGSTDYITIYGYNSNGSSTATVIAGSSKTYASFIRVSS